MFLPSQPRLISRICPSLSVHATCCSRSFVYPSFFDLHRLPSILFHSPNISSPIFIFFLNLFIFGLSALVPSWHVSNDIKWDRFISSCQVLSILKSDMNLAALHLDLKHFCSQFFHLQPLHSSRKGLKKRKMQLPAKTFHTNWKCTLYSCQNGNRWISARFACVAEGIFTIELTCG